MTVPRVDHRTRPPHRVPRAWHRWSMHVIGAIALHALFAIETQADLRINEILSSNRSGLTDEDGDFPDWIEIHNTGPDAIQLENWALSDEPDLPEKWPLPEHPLPSDAYLVVFASGKNRPHLDFPHANFKLKQEGEFLSLTLLSPSPNDEGENPEEGNGAPSLGHALHLPALARDHSYGYDRLAETYRVWRSPTPGAANKEDPSLGPLLTSPQPSGNLAEVGVDHIVSIDTLANGHPIESVTLIQRVMYKVESRAPMLDDGVPPDQIAGDGRYTGKIPARTLFGNRYEAGQMIRWAFEARDTQGNTSRLPGIHPDETAQPEYFGALAEDPEADTPSTLPILHWFTEAPNRAVTQSGHRASVFFDGEFYDNLFVRRRGQFGAIEWAKPKLKFDFNPGDHFLYDPTRRRVEEFNLQSHFRDASFMRENLAFAFFNKIGTPASDTRHWHVRLNGEFFGLFSFVEQVDEDFLRQQGLDPEGALYKANGFPSTLAKTVTEALYQKETRKDEPYDDLEAFAAGINSPDRFDYIMDHVNLPAMVNEMAGQSLIRNADRLTKNYYMYRDPETDRWQRFPWDMDGAFSTSSNLSNENFASPLYGDTQHTQAAGQPIYQNFLLDAILDHKKSRGMYLRRLRTLIDTYLSEDPDYFAGEIERRRALIEADAQADAKEWNTGNIVAGTRALTETAFPLRRRELLETFGKALIPPSQSPDLPLEIDDVHPSPGNASQEYFQINNPHPEAIDLSGWRVEGAVEYTFPSGTVLPSKGTLFNPDHGILYVVKDVRGFRDREEGPRGGQGLFYVGGYAKKLSSVGETIRIVNTEGTVMVEHTYPGIGPTYEAWARTQFEPEELEGESLSGWAADPLGLGVSNLHRYAFGTPSARHSLLTNEDSDALHYHRTANAADLEFEVQYSLDLRTWAPLDDSETAQPQADGTERVEIPLPPRKTAYYRILVRLLSAQAP